MLALPSEDEVGRLMMIHECDVLPLDDEQLMEAANPEKLDWRFDGPEIDAREAFMARHLVSAGPVAVAIVGRYHDLRAEIAAICPDCRVQIIMPSEIDRMNGVGR